MEISLDIETLSTRKNAVVLSIGMCLFDENGIHDDFEVTLETSSQRELGRHVCPDTTEWWREQSMTAQMAAFKGMWSPSDAIWAMTTKIAHWENVHGEMEGVWCKGPSFDGAIIESLCEDLGVDCPVNFSAWRDVRTVIDIAGGITDEGPYVADLKFEGIPHIACDDARHQAKQVIRCTEVIKAACRPKERLVAPLVVNIDWSDIENRVLAHMWPDLVEEDHQVDEAANQAIPRDWSTDEIADELDADPDALKDLLNVESRPFHVGGTVTGRFNGTSIAEQMSDEFLISRKNAEKVNIAAGIEPMDGTFGWDEGVEMKYPDLDETAEEEDPWSRRLGEMAEMTTGWPRVSVMSVMGEASVVTTLEADALSVVKEFQRLTGA